MEKVFLGETSVDKLNVKDTMIAPNQSLYLGYTQLLNHIQSVRPTTMIEGDTVESSRDTPESRRSSRPVEGIHCRCSFTRSKHSVCHSENGVSKVISFSVQRFSLFCLR